ncbi:MAG: hypothetical protein JNM07_13895 [Phycisphaerae bacterium]|nr:hypothetical protein [Phycisphaerae bacterium]
MRSQPVFLAFAALAASVWPVSAQVLTARQSTLNYNYVFGGGADSHTGGEFRDRLTPLASDSDEMSFADSTSGALPGGQPYSAGATAHLSHGYAVAGAPGEIQSISVHASTEVVAAVTGAGSAVMHAVNPGNQIVLSFTVGRAVAYRLSGAITLPGPSPFSGVALQRFNGFNWESIFDSVFIPGGQGPFDLSGTLATGQYRIRSEINLSAGANEAWAASYDYLLDVPGPGSCAADFNGDTSVDDFDYFDFLNAFFADSMAADFNGDTGVDDFDYFDFLNAFFGGC